MGRAEEPARAIKGRRNRGLDVCLLWVLFFILGLIVPPASFAQKNEEDGVRAIAERMKASFQSVEDYSTLVEQIYFKEGIESERSRFHYFFKRPDRIRVDLVQPHSGVTLFYLRGEKKVTLRPFASLPSLKMRFSVDNSILRTPTGQQIHQSDMIFFIDFLFRNLATVPQGDSEMEEGKAQISFLFRAREYVKSEIPERYRISVSTRNWFPLRVERYSPEGHPMEISTMQNYVVNSHLDERFFAP
jgi:outer membrane lipoprotein-sorting protein